MKLVLLLAGARGRAGSDEPGMPGSQTLLLLSLFSRDFCLSLMFMPILVTSHPPRWPLMCISVAAFGHFGGRWLSSSCDNFPACPGASNTLGAFKFFIAVPNPSLSICPSRTEEAGQGTDGVLQPRGGPNPTQEGCSLEATLPFPAWFKEVLGAYFLAQRWPWK